MSDTPLTPEARLAALLHGIEGHPFATPCSACSWRAARLIAVPVYSEYDGLAEDDLLASGLTLDEPMDALRAALAAPAPDTAAPDLRSSAGWLVERWDGNRTVQPDALRADIAVLRDALRNPQALSTLESSQPTPEAGLREALEWSLLRLAERGYRHPDECSPTECRCGFWKAAKALETSDRAALTPTVQATVQDGSTVAQPCTSCGGYHLDHGANGRIDATCPVGPPRNPQALSTLESSQPGLREAARTALRAYDAEAVAVLRDDQDEAEEAALDTVDAMEALRAALASPETQP